MASRKRRQSIDSPPSFSELMNKLNDRAALFIEVFNSREARMRRIVRELQEIAGDVRKMQEATDTDRTVGAVIGGIGLGIGLLAALFTGGASLLIAAAGPAAGAGGPAAGARVVAAAAAARPVAAAVAAAARPVAAAVAAAGGPAAGAGGPAAGARVVAAAAAARPVAAAVAAAAAEVAVAGGALVVGANVRKLKIENDSAKEVEELGKEFMKIVEPLKNDLEEIKTTCEELEQRAAGGQAKRSLSEMGKFQKILRRVSELRERTEGVLLVALAVLEMIGDMVKLIVRVLRVTATPEEDQKLIKSIRQSADQCQKVVNGFDQMKRELRAFTES